MRDGSTADGHSARPALRRRHDHLERDREVMRVSKGRILVVDDEIYIVHILDFSLGMEGYEVLTALDGEQALERLKSDKPDLIVLDIMMPKVDGYEVCRTIKGNPETQHIPVILLSAKG